MEMESALFSYFKRDVNAENSIMWIVIIRLSDLKKGERKLNRIVMISPLFSNIVGT